MSYEYEKNALTLFIEKAEKLKMSKFVVNIANNSGFSFTLEKNKPAVSTRRGPGDENIEAFILTFRFFIQDNEAYSTKGVIRGMHFQGGVHAQAKLVRVVAGEVLDVVVDLRKTSPTYLKHFSIILSSENKN